MDVLAGRQVHHRIGSPPRRPDHLVDLFGHRRGDRRVTDVGIYLHQKIAADDHRLELWMIYVCRNDGAATRNLVSDELRSDPLLDLRAPRHTRVLRPDLAAGAVVGQRPLAGAVLPDRDKLHLRGDLAIPRIVHLSRAPAGPGAPRPSNARIPDIAQRWIGRARPAVLG